MPFISPLIYKNNIKNRKSITLNARNILITQALLNKKINISRGKGYFSKIVTKADMGHKLGEYAHTKCTKDNLHVKKKLKNQINKKKK